MTETEQRTLDTIADDEAKVTCAIDLGSRIILDAAIQLPEYKKRKVVATLQIVTRNNRKGSGYGDYQIRFRYDTKDGEPVVKDYEGKEYSFKHAVVGEVFFCIVGLENYLRRSGRVVNESAKTQQASVVRDQQTERTREYRKAAEIYEYLRLQDAIQQHGKEWIISMVPELEKFVVTTGQGNNLASYEFVASNQIYHTKSARHLSTPMGGKRGGKWGRGD